MIYNKNVKNFVSGLPTERNYMKRSAIILLAVLMLLSSCGGQGAVTEPTDTSEITDLNTEPNVTEPTVTEPSVTDEPDDSTSPEDDGTQLPETSAPDVSDVPREDFTIAVEDDTYVINSDANGDTSNVSYHDADRIHIKSEKGNTLRRYSYIRFDIAELKEAGNFTAVELGLTVAFRQNNPGNPENIKINIYACEDWGDGKLTYADQPVRYGLVYSRDDVTTKDETYTFFVTDYVKKLLKEGKTAVAFLIEEATPEKPLHVQFYTKEGNPDKAASLSVSYTKTDSNKYEEGENENLPDGLDVLLSSDTNVETYTLIASEDSYVSGGESDIANAASTVLGDSAILDFKANYSGKQEQHRIVYLKFDLTGYSVSDFDRATLRLYCRSEQSSEGADILVYACDPNSWSDKTLTYNNKPENGKLVTRVNSAKKGFVSIELTDYVVECLKNGAKAISLCLTGDTALPRRMTFTSVESGNNPPTLILTDGSSNFTADLKYSGINPWSYAMKLVNTWKENREKIASSVGTANAETVTPVSAEYNLTVDAAINTETDGYNTKYTQFATRTVDSLKGYAYNTGEAALYDVYGGYTGGEKYEATGYFYTKFVDGRWWTIDPLGYPFFRTAVVGIGRGSSNQSKLALSKYGTAEAWAQAATDRLWELGFNSAGGWSDITTLANVSKPLAQTKILYFMKYYSQEVGAEGAVSGSTEFAGGVMPVFDPEFETFCDRQASKELPKYANNPNIYGWMSDNELRINLKTLDNCLNLDPTGKTAAYSYATAWTYMYVMTGKENVSAADITDELRDDFLAMTYDRYFSVVEAAIHKYDPNHMYIGCRFIRDNYSVESVMKVAGYYCDVIFFNYYKVWTPDFEFLANIQKWTDTPFIITEWYAKGMDVWEKDNRLTNTDGSGWTVRTQTDRGLFYQNYALAMLESKYCIGFDWFQYHDNDPENLNADPSNRNANKGIYSNSWEEYTDLTEQMKFLNKNIYSLIEFFDER